MKFTNKYNLPDPLFQLLTYDDYQHKGDFSVTELLLPPRIRQLRKRYYNEITEDCIDRLWSVLGKIGHKLIDQVDVENAITEERLYLAIKGVVIAAKPDLWMPNFLDDYKFTTVWTGIFWPKEDYVKQINYYAPFYEEAGFKVDQLFITCIYRDWQLSKKKYDKDYPPQIQRFEVKKTPDIINDMTERISLHYQFMDTPDDELPFCSDNEVWAKPTMYAVRKPKLKRALRIFDSMEFANKFKNAQPIKDKVYIETRLGRRPRCEDYCNVNQWCNQYQKYLQEKERS